ncbi:MAG TPA: translation initiation factor IF-3 [Sedimentisphaerales bacterium]|nr:translation initiation factor IF-3 [Sedimentisphaerales bacterium]
MAAAGRPVANCSFRKAGAPISKQRLRINEGIRTSPVRLIDAENQQLGIVNIDEALARAREAELDLVEVSPTAEPPVCRIMDYGKYLYELKRKEKIAQKKQHIAALKEIRMRPKIDPHDQGVKINQVRAFLEKGHKVQLTIQFRGREMVYLDQGRRLMDEVLAKVQDVAKIEKPSALLGRRMTMVISPAKTK